MKLGIITSPDAEGVKRVSRLGLRYAEFDINGDDIGSVTSGEQAVKAALAENGVELCALGRWGRNRLKGDLSVNEKEQEDEFRLMDFCDNTGCGVYICGVNYVEGLSYYENITAAMGYLRDLIRYAADRVKVCTYNCRWNNYIHQPREWDIFHDHIKNLGIKYDPSHAVNARGDYLSELARYGGKIDHVHLKGTMNIDGSHIDDPPAGLDMINWGAFLSILRKHGYTGALAIEPHSQTWQGELGEKGLQYTVNYFKKLLFLE